MTLAEYKNLTLNQRVKFTELILKEGGFITKHGYVTKIYNGNYQLQIWFDGDPKPRTLGYTNVEIIN